MSIQTQTPHPGMVITESTRLAPGVYDFTEGEGLTIAADGITVEAEGVVLRGGCTPGSGEAASNTDAFGYGGNAKGDNARLLGFHGTGLTLEGRRNVTVRGLAMKGFDQGARLLRCTAITLSGCDFSDCFTDPAWGWDEHGFHGGILMIESHDCRIEGCTAQRVWDALNMRHSHRNHILNNCFSHTSDTGLKLWHACHNTIDDNDFSYGIRIDPGEVHARDSSSVLIESGSNHNRFCHNDMTHGGDGLFIRVLNGWMSTHNVFEDNDCSYANNNAVEAWADCNTYIRTKANHSSYGFWLGNSDHTVLIDNEAAYNGVTQRNAPEAFGNCGIAIVNGSGSHSVLRGNYVHDNGGPGIAIRHDLRSPSFHWIIENNRLERNRTIGRYAGHGIYLKNVRWVSLAGNVFTDNDGEPIRLDGNVSDRVSLFGQGEALPPLSMAYAPRDVRVGEDIAFSTDGDPDLRYRWDFGDGCTSAGQRPVHAYTAPGLYAVGVTADNGGHAALAAQNLYVLPADFLPFAQDTAQTLDAEAQVSVVQGLYGEEAVEASATAGKAHTLVLAHEAPLLLEGRDALYLQLRYVSDADTDWGRATRYPVVQLAYDGDNSLTFTPTAPLLEMLYAKRNEEKDNGRLFILPLRGHPLCERTVAGEGIARGITRVSLTYGGMSGAYSTLTVNALGFGAEPVEAPARVDLCAGVSAIEATEAAPGSPLDAPFSQNSFLNGDETPRILMAGDGYYGVRFETVRTVDHVQIGFYQNATHTANAHGERLPKACHVEALADGRWAPVVHAPVRIRENAMTDIRFAPLRAAGVRVVFQQGDGPAAIYAFHAYHDRAVPGIRVHTPARMVPIDRVEVKLNTELNGNGCPLGDLVARVFQLDAEEKLATCLYETTVARSAIGPYAITQIPTPGLSLEEGTRYALALGQTNEAASRTEGDYYRWIAGEVADKQTFAIYTDGETKPTDHDWGTAWLRIISGDAVQAYVHDSQHVGTRFGIRDMQYRYQTFAAPRLDSLLTDGRAAGAGFPFGAGYDNVTVQTPAPCVAEALHVYLGDESADAALLLTDENGQTIAGLARCQEGLNVLAFAARPVQTLTLTLTGTGLLYEVELLQG